MSSATSIFSAAVGRLPELFELISNWNPFTGFHKRVGPVVVELSEHNRARRHRLALNLSNFLGKALLVQVSLHMLPQTIYMLPRVFPCDATACMRVKELDSQQLTSELC